MKSEQIARIQKKLTKVVPYLRSELTHRIGLKYAPEIRFYKDDSVQFNLEV